MSRAPVPARMRFEVFKRDKFTCQYCGARAPDVLLQCDHITPVAGGGANELLNLITSCSRCNGGKGAIPLSDSSRLDRQHDLLADLEERRQQIEAMLLWRDELRSLSQNTVESLERRIEERSTFRLNEAGRSDLSKWLKKFEIELLLRAIDESADSYLQFIGDAVEQESWDKFFRMIPAVANILKQQEDRPHLRRLFYIQGIIRRRAKMPRYDCLDYLEHIHLCGADLDEMEHRAKRMHELEDFEAPYDAWLSQIGRPF